MRMVIETPSFTQLESNRDSNSPDLFLPAGRVQGCGSAGYAAPPRAGDEGSPGGGAGAADPVRGCSYPGPADAADPAGGPGAGSGSGAGPAPGPGPALRGRARLR